MNLPGDSRSGSVPWASALLKIFVDSDVSNF